MFLIVLVGLVILVMIFYFRFCSGYCFKFWGFDDDMVDIVYVYGDLYISEGSY